MERIEKEVANSFRWQRIKIGKPMCRASFLFLLASLAMCLHIELVQARSGAALQQDYWQIDYTSNFAGKMRVKFHDQAISMKMEKLGLTVISTAPTWNSLVYNDLNKCFMNVSNEQWKESKFIENLLRRRKESMGELKTEYTSNVRSVAGQETTQVLVKNKTPDGAYETSSEIWVTKTLNVPSQFKRFLQVALGVSENFTGTPLQIWVTQKDHVDKTPHVVQALAAYKITKMPGDEKAFASLKGYKEVKREVNLMVDEEAN